MLEIHTTNKSSEFKYPSYHIGYLNSDDELYILDEIILLRNKFISYEDLLQHMQTQFNNQSQNFKIKFAYTKESSTPTSADIIKVLIKSLIHIVNKLVLIQIENTGELLSRCMFSISDKKYLIDNKIATIVELGFLSNLKLQYYNTVYANFNPHLSNTQLPNDNCYHHNKFKSEQHCESCNKCEKGDKGDKGERGERGERGASGPSGSIGGTVVITIVMAIVVILLVFGVGMSMLMRKFENFQNVK